MAINVGNLVVVGNQSREASVPHKNTAAVSTNPKVSAGNFVVLKKQIDEIPVPDENVANTTIDHRVLRQNLPEKIKHSNYLNDMIS